MTDATDGFIEMMGRHFEEEGVARIAGRLFGLLMLVERESTLDELAEALKVSKGSVSSNARLLEEWGVAERVTRPGDRRDFYRIAADMSERLVNRQIERMQLFIQRVNHSRAELGELAEPAADRFDEVIRFNSMAIESLRGLGTEMARSRRRPGGG
ncbi:MAG TPA: MarR family transcriptional regulator [Longimicrobium sp.]|nr:MarR family transcriptional regulator [Longimicrobium sp.]